MPKPSLPVQKIRLSDIESTPLRLLARKIHAASVMISTAQSNLDSFHDFIDQAEAKIASLPDEDEKKGWKKRMEHCQSVQISEERANLAVANALLDRYEKSMALEKAKWKNPVLMGDEWMVDP